LEAYLREKIPLSAAMGTQVHRAGPDGVVLAAPIEPNLNHHTSAFGGSIAALSILAGWALVHVRLREEGSDAHTVVQTSDLAFVRPAHGPIEARTSRLDGAAWTRFRRCLARWGRGRIRVRVEVTSDGRQVATLDAEYVALAAGLA
jgi:thioesterase domain-containing protein